MVKDALRIWQGRGTGEGRPENMDTNATSNQHLESTYVPGIVLSTFSFLILKTT